MTKKQIREKELEEKREALRGMLKEGDTVYTKVVHVSRSGMYRVINLYVMLISERNGKPYPYCIDHLAAPLLEGYDYRHRGCKATGCGMDMGFSLVYSLAWQLFGHIKRDNKDNGYLLNQKWL